VANLLTNLPDASGGEVFEQILTRPGARIERIVSQGQSTPADAPFLQAHDEWVLLLTGGAGLRIEGEDEKVLKPGDHLLIPGGKPHCVTWTAADEPTVWLAVHFEGD
jgi:cupin 2 domain-containing protein